MDASRKKEHQPSTAEVLRIKLVSRGNVTARKVLFRIGEETAGHEFLTLMQMKNWQIVRKVQLLFP